MADIALPVTSAPLVVKPTKKTKDAEGTKRQKKAAIHPPVKTMLVAAIKALKERNGSSLHAIKKYLAASYNEVNVDKLVPFLKKALKTGVASGRLVQTKGTGASGSFKLSAEAKKQIAEKKKVVSSKKPTSGRDKQKKASAKQSAAIQKKKTKAATASKKPKTTSKSTASKQKSTKPSKKSSATKPRTPKPKKTAGLTKKPSAKKANSSKK